MTPLYHSDRNPVSSLAVDLGANSGRVVVGRISDGRWELKEIGRFQTPAKQVETSGYQCWQINEIADQIQSCLGQAVDREGIASIGVDSWGVDYVLLDEQRHPVSLPICYRDPRTTGVMETIQDLITPEEIYRRTGIQFLPFNTLYQLAACAVQEPEWLAAARHFLMIPDYLHFRLSGILSNEYTNATTTQMCGLDGNWDRVLLEAVGIKRAIMCDPVPAGTVLGDGAGAAKGLKIIAPATHDTASAVAGTPLTGDREAFISSGTWSLMGIESASPIVTREALEMNFTNEGGFQRRFRVLKNIMGLWPLQRICEEHEINDLPLLLRQCEEADPWRSIIDVNNRQYLSPLSMTDSIKQSCRKSHQPVPESLSQIARCILESLALSYGHVKDQIEALSGKALGRIRIVGGGCQNRLLNQLCANVCGLPVSAGPIEASALGNLTVQMIALGQIDSLENARSVIQRSFEIDEYRPRADVPASIFRRFKELCAAQEMKGEPCA